MGLLEHLCPTQLANMYQNSSSPYHFHSPKPHMPSLEQVQADIQTLSPEALDAVYRFIQTLKTANVDIENHSSSQTLTASETATDWSDLIGSISAEEDLSVNHKKYLAEALEEKYDHR